MTSVACGPNEKGFLALSRDIAKIAIIGPHADDVAAGFTTYTYLGGLKMMEARAYGGEIAMAWIDPGGGAPPEARAAVAAELASGVQGGSQGLRQVQLLGGVLRRGGPPAPAEGRDHRRRGHRSGAVMHYSITSSARASTAGGIVSPRAFAVLRLITSSNLVGCSTGRIGGVHTLEDLVHVGGNTSVEIGEVHAV